MLRTFSKVITSQSEDSIFEDDDEFDIKPSKKKLMKLFCSAIDFVQPFLTLENYCSLKRLNKLMSVKFNTNGFGEQITLTRLFKKTKPIYSPNSGPNSKNTVVINEFGENNNNNENNKNKQENKDDDSDRLLFISSHITNQKNLKSIILCPSYSYSVESIMQLLSQCSNLKFIDLTSCKGITVDNIALLISIAPSQNLRIRDDIRIGSNTENLWIRCGEKGFLKHIALESVAEHLRQVFKSSSSQFPEENLLEKEPSLKNTYTKFVQFCIENPDSDESRKMARIFLSNAYHVNKEFLEYHKKDLGLPIDKFLSVKHSDLDKIVITQIRQLRTDGVEFVTDFFGHSLKRLYESGKIEKVIKVVVNSRATIVDIPLFIVKYEVCQPAFLAPYSLERVENMIKFLKNKFNFSFDHYLNQTPNSPTNQLTNLDPRSRSRTIKNVSQLKIEDLEE